MFDINKIKYYQCKQKFLPLRIFKCVSFKFNLIDFNFKDKEKVLKKFGGKSSEWDSSI